MNAGCAVAVDVSGDIDPDPVLGPHARACHTDADRAAETDRRGSLQ